MVTRITPLPTPVPQSSDPQNFDQRADQFLTALPTFADEANQVAEEMDDAVDTAQAASSAALSNAGFVGRWEDQSGPAAPPYSVFRGGLFWSLLEPIADVSLSAPDPYNTDWAVTGAPSWYNNFAVGDYLDTARSPGSGWLRRNGAAYERSTWPELAPLMPAVVPGFVWTGHVKPTSMTRVCEGADGLYGIERDFGTSTTRVYRSTDGGETWALVSTAPIFGWDIAYGDGKLVVVGTVSDLGRAVVSENSGATWGAPVQVSPHLSRDEVRRVIYDGTAFIAINFSGNTTPATGRIFRAIDPSATWAVVKADTGSVFLEVSVTQPGEVAVVGGGDDRILISEDSGETWSAKAPLSVPSSAFQAIAHWGGVYVLANNTASVFTTTDFVTLTEHVLAGAILQAAAYNGGIMIGNQTGELWFSSDGYNWDMTTAGSTSIISDLIAIGESRTTVIGLDDTHALIGVAVESSQFLVPSDNPATGWIKAVSDSPGTVGYAGVPEAPLSAGPFGRQGGAWVDLGESGGQVNADWNADSGPAEILNKPEPGGDLVGTTGTQTLTNKTIGANTKESVTVASTITINDAAAPFQQITLVSNATATINLSVGVSRTIWLNPGTYTVTWPAGTVLVGGIENLSASKWSLITLTGMPSNTAGVAALVASQP